MSSPERWADIAGYEGLYQVSDLGRVRSLPRVSCGRSVGGRILKGSMPKSRCGRKVRLSKDGKQSFRYVSRLVAEAFVPNPDGLRSVLRKDGDRTNDSADNLVWSDQPTNDAENWSARRSVPVVRDDGERYPSISAAARAHGVTAAALRQAVHEGGMCQGHRFRLDGWRAPRETARVRFEPNTLERMRISGRELKRLMTSARVTVNDMAERTGMSPKKIWMMRSGAADPSRGDLEKVAEVLGVDPGSLVEMD